MLAVTTDHPDPLPALRNRGIDARLAWYGDHDTAALVFVPADPGNLRRLERWLEPTAKPTVLNFGWTPDYCGGIPFERDTYQHRLNNHQRGGGDKC